MRFLLGFIGVVAWAFQVSPPAVREVTHLSGVLGENRGYRVLLPAGYAESQKRYPVVYWLTGFEQSSDERDRAFARYVASHELIVVQAGPVETTGEYPLYFAELVDHVDRTLRTVPDREHRGVTGFFAAGFAAYLIAGKYPDLVGSASNFMGSPEGSAGPKNFAAEYRHDDHYNNFEGVRTRLVIGPRSPLEFYHRRFDGIWQYTRTGHETVRLDSEAPDAGVAETLDFHMGAFATPLPRPAAFHHGDPYPIFSVWGWQVISNRKQPGFTVLENVGPRGFRCAVREWAPAGAPIPAVKLSITSPRLAPPGTVRTVTFLRLRDGNFRRASQKADAEGRFSFDLDGEAYEVGIGAEPLVTVSGYEVADEPWATAGKPVKLRVKFWNKGAARFVSGDVLWSSPNAGVTVEPVKSRLFGMAPGESAALPVNITVADPQQSTVRIVAAVGSTRLPLDITLFPAAEPAPVFRIADGSTVDAYQHATEPAELAFGTGNADGHAAPGENFAVLIPDGELLRAAELFTNDPCVDNGLRAADSWGQFAVRFSLPTLRPDCTPGKIIRMLARVMYPNQQVRYFTVEFPVWYRPE